MAAAAFFGAIAPQISSGGDTDPLFAYVRALAHFNGDLGDEVSAAWTNGGNVVASTTSPRFGTGCAAFDGSANGYLKSQADASFAIGSGAYTREVWFRGIGTPANAYIFDAGSGNQRAMNFNPAGRLAYYDPVLGVSGDLWNNGPSNSVLCDGAWHHLAITKDESGIVRGFADGVAWGEDESSFNDSAATLWLGRYGGSDGYALFGWLDDHRFTNGVCRYTSNFTPPAAPFPNS